jgi:hypothetical protein
MIFRLEKLFFFFAIEQISHYQLRQEPVCLEIMMIKITNEDKALYEQGKFTISSIEQAYADEDPRLAEYIIKLAIIDPAPKKPEEQTDAPVSNWQYSSMRKEYHVDLSKDEKLSEVETIDLQFSKLRHQIKRAKKAGLAKQYLAELQKVPELVPERLKLDTIILTLWEDKSHYSQNQLLKIIEEVPLKWGPWRAIKRIFKLSYLLQEWSIYIAIANRLYGVSAYIRTRRGRNNQKWEINNQILPVDMEKVRWNSSWYWKNRARANDLTVESKVFLNKMQEFHLQELESNFGEAFVLVATEALLRVSQWTTFTRRLSESNHWLNSAGPLLRVFSEAKSNQISLWALNLLIKHFREDLATLPTEWIVKQATSTNSSREIKRFVFQWFVEPITKVQQSDFYEKGLHVAVLAFIDYTAKLESGWQDSRWLKSWHPNPGKKTWTQLAREFACTYIRSCMHQLTEDINLDKVLWLMRNKDNQLHELGKYMLFPDSGESPYREQLDLEFWTSILGDSRLHSLAQKVLEKDYSGRDLSKEWYRERLLSGKKVIIDMVLEWLEDPTRYREEEDFYDVYIELLRDSKTKGDVRTWAYRNLTIVNAQGGMLQDRFDAELYRNLLLSPIQLCQSIAIKAFENSIISYEAFSVSFLINLTNDSEFKHNKWKSYVSSEEVVTKLPKNIRVMAYSAVVNHPDLPLDELGYDWVFSRVTNWSKEYDFIRKVFNEKFPIHLLGGFENTSDGHYKAGQWILNEIFSGWDANSTKAKFWRSFILNRIPIYRNYIDMTLPKLADELRFPVEIFDFEWFLEIMKNNNHIHRQFGFDIASLRLSNWMSMGGVGFLELKDLLFSVYDDVQQFVLECMHNPKYPESKIDITKPSFKSEDLYSFCFDGRDEVRSMGIQIIEKFPFRYGQPSKLLVLSNSSDSKVREMVIRVIWRQCEIPTVTPNWKPYEQSVLPQGGVGKNLVRALRSNPPKGLDIKELKPSIKYLGVGTPKEGELQLDSFEEIEDFIRRSLFRLPPGRRSPKLPKLSFSGNVTWKNKRTLVQAVRDLGIKNKQFAEYILPILVEFQISNGKIVREACISALMQIDIAHNLNIFGGEQ